MFRLKTKHFSISTVLLVLTWICIACFFAAKYVSKTAKANEPKEMPHFVNLEYGFLHPQIPDEGIAESPVWDYTNEHPPISARKVLEIAESFRQSQLPKIKSTRWALTSIQLFPIDAMNAKWCWCINFAEYPSGRAELGHSVTMYVMMDGKTLDPCINDGRLSDATTPQVN
jgi:hypothetical protein